MVTARDLPHAPMPMECYVHVKSKFRGKKKLVLPLRNIRLLYYPGILQRLLHLIIQFPLYYLSVVAYGRLKKRKFQTFSSESGPGRLQEVPNVVIWPKNVWYFGKLVAEEKWSLTRGGRNRRFDCT